MGLSNSIPNAVLQQGVCTSSTRPSSPYVGQTIYETDTGCLVIYNGSAWCVVTPKSASVATSQSTNSTTYVDLTTVGPAVTIDTGTRALVTISCELKATAAPGSYPYDEYATFAVSGATTIAATDDYAIEYWPAANNYTTQMSRHTYLTTLTAGTNTFTMKYRTGGNTVAYQNRVITVVAVP